MEARLERLYKRLGPKYAFLFVGWVTFVALLAGVVVVACTITYLKAERSQLFDLFLAWQITNVGALLIVVLLARRIFGNALKWGSGTRTPEIAAQTWSELVHGVPRLCLIGVLVFAGLGVVSEIDAAIILDLPWYAVPIMFMAVFVVIVTAAMLDYFGVEQLCRPILREVATYLPPDFKPLRSSVPVGWRVFGTVTTISFVGAMMGAQSAAGDFSPVGRLGMGVGGALLVTVTLGLAMTLFLDRSLTTPIGDLISATRRVEQGELDQPVPLLSGDEIGTLAQSFNRMMVGLKEREVLLSAMGVYVDPEVATRVLIEGKTQGGHLLAGQDMELTVVVIDIRDFTAYAEQQGPQETVRYLNSFFALVVPEIVKHGGHVNKFLGDGVLAVFGAPDPRPDHADRALAAVRDILDAVTSNHGDDIQFGIGVNSGNVVVGSVGGGGRLEFTLIGDAVNVAARIEQLTKETGDKVLVTEETRCKLTGSAIELEYRGFSTIRGRAGEIKVYAFPEPGPVAVEGDAASNVQHR
jgi:adenylate cyclase